MKTHGIFYLALSFLAVYIGIGSYVVAASTLELTQTSHEIKGTDSDSGVAFQASLPTNGHVVINTTFGTTKIHADIDYTRHALRVVSVSQATGTTVLLSVQDIVAFQKLRVSLTPIIGTGSVLGDALSSLINLVASAPAGNAINITSVSATFTSICAKIGGQDVAIYKLKGTTYSPTVTVGPVCYVPPALGRCGAGGGRDPVIGLVQRFTQQCLNHDQCCVATMNRIIGGVNICGNSGTECVPEFVAAAPGFFFAPDCGTTAGNWTDNYGYTYVLTGGDSSGQATAFSGTVNTNSTSPACGTWNVAGTRTGTNIVFTATNPSGASAPNVACVASYTYTGTYSNCNVASGSWVNTGGESGAWSWNRTNTVNAMSLVSGANTLHRPTSNQ